MKKNLFRIITATLLIVFMFAFCVTANAMHYMEYTRNTDDPTFTVLGSLQANKYTESGVYAFQRIFATNRFDPTGNGTPTYTLLDMQIIVTGSGVTLLTPIVASQDRVIIGQFIRTEDVRLSQESGITFLKGTYYATVPGSTVSFNPPSIEISVFN